MISGGLSMYVLIYALSLDLSSLPSHTQQIGDVIDIVEGRFKKSYYHDVPFSWINDAEIRLQQRRILREKIQQVEEALADRKLRNARSENSFKGFMLSPYEAFTQGIAPGETKGQVSTHWFMDYCGTPIDPFCFIPVLYLFLMARIFKTIRNWGPLRRHLHPPGYLNKVPTLYLADMQQSAAEKACRPLSRWSLSFMATKFRITLSQSSTGLVELYYWNEERDPHPDPWLTVKSVLPFMRQHKRITREDKSIMAVAQEYADKAGRTEAEKNEMRGAIFQKLKTIEKGIPLDWEGKLKRNYRMLRREDIKEEERKHRKEMVAAIEARTKMKREKKQQAEELYEVMQRQLLEEFGQDT